MDVRAPLSIRSRRSSEEPCSDEGFSDTLSLGQKFDNGGPKRKRLREQTKAACLRCKKRKGKCSGERPTCAYCTRRNITCQYDVRVGSSRRAELEHKLQEATTRSTEMGIFLHALQHGSDEQSTMLLARLRMGESLDEIVHSLLAPEDMTAADVDESLAEIEGPEDAVPTRARRCQSQNEPIKEATISTPEDHISHFESKPISRPSADALRWTSLAEADFKLKMPQRQKAVCLDKYEVQSLQAENSSPNPGCDFVKPLFDKRKWEVMSQPRGWILDQDGPSTASTHYNHTNISMSAYNLEALVSTPRKCGCGPDDFCEHGDTLSSAFVDPTFGNLFGNLAFSGAIRANHFPIDVQDQQVSNLSVPSWAMKVVNGYWDFTNKEDSRALTVFRDEHRGALTNGISADALFGLHPMVGALVDENVFRRAPPLSQWAARMVKSIKSGTADLTQCASLHHFWILMRWMIYPTPATYQAIPITLRPTPEQLFTAHPMLFDFIAWPALRGHCIKDGSLHADTRWLRGMSETITVNWKERPLEYLWKNPITGELDLTPAAKEDYVDSIENWSVGSSMRHLVKNADAYMRIG